MNIERAQLLEGEPGLSGDGTVSEEAATEGVAEEAATEA